MDSFSPTFEEFFDEFAQEQEAEETQSLSEVSNLSSSTLLTHLSSTQGPLSTRKYKKVPFTTKAMIVGTMIEGGDWKGLR